MAVLAAAATPAATSAAARCSSFAKHPIRHKLWKIVTPLNARHMLFAWISLFGVALADLYVRLVASGTIHDPGFHF